MEMNLTIVQEDADVAWYIGDDEDQEIIHSEGYTSLEYALKGCNQLMRQLAFTLKSIKIEDRRKKDETNCENTTRGSS